MNSISGSSDESFQFIFSRNLTEKIKRFLKVVSATLVLIFFPFLEVNASLSLDAGNDLGANGLASNTFEQSVSIDLHPNMEAVGQGVQTVSFGFPLPPGTIISTSQIVVVDENDQEVPAYVRSLAGWNAMPPVSLLCDGYQSSGNPGIRSVLIQFESQFDSGEAKSFSILLNRTRQLTIDSEVDIHTTLVEVGDGIYADHNLAYRILEPGVLAAIEPQYLSCTNLTTLAGESNKNPDMNATDQAQNNFFYTAVQEYFGRVVDNPDDIHDFVNGSAAYWLYDRPQTFLNGYLRSGNVDQLREGLRAANHYRNEIYTKEECDEKTTLLSVYDCPGFFKAKNTDIAAPYKDSKYSYSESLVTAYLLTGDEGYLANIPLVTHAVMENVNFDSDTATERHRANGLLTTVMDYELSRDKNLLAYINNAIDQLYARQKIALDGVTVNGCFNYSPEETDVDSFSPWMSSLLANALLRAYQVVGDNRIPEMLVDLAQCEVDRALFRTDIFISDVVNDPFPNMLVPYYIAQSYGEKRDLDGGEGWSSVEHAIDVALPIALGAYFSTDAVQQAVFLETTRDLLKTHDYRIRYWTRDYSGRPLFRLAPPRKYSWQYKNVGTISWVLDKLDNSDWLFVAPDETPVEPVPVDPAPGSSSVDPAPIDPVAVAPAPLVGVNFIADDQFDHGVDNFIAAGVGQVTQTQESPLSGVNSLLVEVGSWSKGAVFTKNFAWNSGVSGKMLKLEAKAKVISAESGAHINICAVAYYQDNSERFEICDILEGDSTTVKSFSLVLALDNAKQLSRVYFYTQLIGNGPSKFLLDEVSLLLSDGEEPETDAPGSEAEPSSTIHFIMDGAFDNGVSEFVAAGVGQVTQTQESPLSGANSLLVEVGSWSKGAVFTNNFTWNSGVSGKMLKLEAKAKVISAENGTHINICAVAYYQDNSERFETCNILEGDSTTVKSFSLVLALDNTKQLSRVYFYTQLIGYGPFDFLLDDSSLLLAQ